MDWDWLGCLLRVFPPSLFNGLLNSQDAKARRTCKAETHRMAWPSSWRLPSFAVQWFIKQPRRQGEGLAKLKRIGWLGRLLGVFAPSRFNGLLNNQDAKARRTCKAETHRMAWPSSWRLRSFAVQRFIKQPRRQGAKDLQS
jgi:hypothetical protein